MLALKRPPLFPARAPRAAVNISAHLLLADDRVVGVRLRNLSSRGFLGHTSLPLDAGTWLGVELVGYGILRAVVCWSEDGEFGCQFRSKIDLARLGRAVTANPVGCTLFQHA